MTAKTFSAQVVGGQLRHQESLDAFEGREVRVTIAAPSLVLSPSSPSTDSSGAERPLATWPAGFFDRIREDWGDEPFERPPQGEFEIREDC